MLPKYTNLTPNAAIGESLGHCHLCDRDYVRTLDDAFSAVCPDCEHEHALVSAS